MKNRLHHQILLFFTGLFTLSLLSCSLFGQQSSLANIGLDEVTPENQSISPPLAGDHELRILSPHTLELLYITSKAADKEPAEWNFVDANLNLHLPAAEQLLVKINGSPVTPKIIGFKRRVAYAPKNVRDLRLSNSLFLELTDSISLDAQVEISNPSGLVWKKDLVFTAKNDSTRWTPVIHVNQIGYAPSWPKKAMVGYYLGDLGELEIPAGSKFRVLDIASNQPVFEGILTLRQDKGFTFPVLPYQAVWEADFSALNQPGDYRIDVPGLGQSYLFRIHEGIPAAYARSYALGLYHQRCGADNSFPYTRYTHNPCHSSPVEIPTPNFAAVQIFLKQFADNTIKEQLAPPLSSIEKSLFPFVKTGSIDLRGGHHDAGDYSRYTIDSAQFIHLLMTAVDSFDGVSGLDNLGIPESGDGIPDVLQIAKYEVDFLAKMQDDDGGFYFMVYPKERKYEDDVLPDHGDRQVVYPKNSAASAAAVAALAQVASSPLFKKNFPYESEKLLQQAIKGWDFLEAAWKRYGRDYIYQGINGYGDIFLDRDETVWAAVELFIATKNDKYHQYLLKNFTPTDPDTRRWTWWKLFEGYGCAIRSYALAEKAGKITKEQLNANFLKACQDEILSRGDDLLKWGNDCAYETSFSSENKRFQTSGWYFSEDNVFDLITAYLIEPRPAFMQFMVNNMNYVGGVNPVNAVYVTGLGWRRQHEIVHQYAQNDKRILPLDGIPIGNVQRGFMYLPLYGKELTQLSYPSDEGDQSAYPMYDRWSDTFDVNNEFTILNLARALAASSYWMAQTPVKNQPWKAGEGSIDVMAHPSHPGDAYQVQFHPKDMPEPPVQILWETSNKEVSGGMQPSIRKTSKISWIEADAVWADGRRVFAHIENVTGPVQISGVSDWAAH